MANSKKPIGLNVNILGRDYRVNCPPGAEEELLRSGRYLNDKMEEIRQASSQAGKVLGADRIAVIAALNITHQMLMAEEGQNKTVFEIERLNERVDSLLDQDSQLEF